MCIRDSAFSASWVCAAATMLRPRCSASGQQSCTGMPLPVMRWGPYGRRHPSDPLVISFMVFGLMRDASPGADESMTPRRECPEHHAVAPGA
eukprot:9520669-Heterocapsa_arctica.AAC.1